MTEHTIISIRQPWAWLIVHGSKRIENRTWRTNYRGPILIHASSGMTRAEYESALEFMSDHNLLLSGFPPRPERLERGGIIGRAQVVDCISGSSDPWFMGPYGHVLADVQPLEFRKLKAKLGYFKQALSDVDLCPPKETLIQQGLL
jgi:hypothetical protein